MTASASSPLSTAHSRPFSAIIVGGLVVGVLDMTYAILVYSRKHPIRIPQTIASGALGTKSFNLDGQSAALGVVLHFVIALSAAAVYYVASRKLTILIHRAVPLGLVYGGLVYGFMHLVVLPLSAAPHRSTPLIYKACEFIWHWFGVGLPISLSVRHYSTEFISKH